MFVEILFFEPNYVCFKMIFKKNTLRSFNEDEVVNFINLKFNLSVF